MYNRVIDPWLERQKRSALSRDERDDHLYKATLIEALGNAAMERSLDHIISYINMTGDYTPTLWRRSGVFSLRFFQHDEVGFVIIFYYSFQGYFS